MQENVVVVGLGEIGLAIAVALAQRGCKVTGYDIDEGLVADLRRQNHIRHGASAFDAALSEAVGTGVLAFDTVLEPARAPRAYVLAVPTPLAGSAFDDRPLTSALDAVQGVAAAGDLVVVKSTVPIGTTRSLARKLRAAGLDLDIAHCPERSIVGDTFAEQFSIPHIVGGIDDRSSRRAAALFGRLGAVVTVGSPDAAEAIKLFANARRDVLFGLANEFALICENLGLDMYEIGKAGAIDYPRGGLARPGPVGGPCLPKDTHLLALSVPGAQTPHLSLAARAVNEHVVTRVAETLAAHLKSLDEADRTVAILGVAFKGVPTTGDIRGSAALTLMRLLTQNVANVVFRGWDAVVAFDTLTRLGLAPREDILAAAAGASVVVIANDHPKFRQLAVAEIGAVMRKPALIYDMCGTIARPAAMPDEVSLRTFGVGAAHALRAA
jgi:nucleotide sugar dehydrogenase